MERKINSDEQKALELLALVNYTGHVVCHEPSKLSPVGKVQLLTQDEARSHLESSQNVALLFPSRSQVLDNCRNLVNEQKVVTVVQETSSFLSMVENIAKVVDFLGDKQKFLKKIYRLLPAGDQLRSRDLIYIAYDLGKCAGEQFEVHWINDVTWDDLILPIQTLRKHRVEETLRSYSEVRYVAVGQRNGCIPIHQPGDVTTLRISYTSTSVLPQQSRRFLEDILANINDEDIQEAQFRSFVPWKNNGFMDLHETGIDTTIIDIAGFDDAHRTILVETLTTLNICYFVPFKNKLFIPGTGHFINQLRLTLLRTDVHLPTGMKQGSFQLTCWKSTRTGLHKKHRVFLCQTSLVGGLSTIPMQAEFLQQSHVFQELSALSSHRELSEHPVGKYLQSELSADNLAINFTRSHRGNCKVLTFDIPSSSKHKFPYSFAMQKETIQVAHRGGLPRDQSVTGPTVYSETNREHWENVIQRGMPGGFRKNVLIPDKSSVHSTARFDQLSEHTFTSDDTWHDITLGNEDAPFIFSPEIVDPQLLSDTMVDLLRKSQSDTRNSNFLEALEKGEVRWCHSDQIATVNTLSSSNWRIFCFRTLPRQALQLKHICHRRDKFSIISNSSLSILSFEPTTICHAIPPGTAPKLVITPWNNVQLIACGIISATAHEQLVSSTDEERARKFTVDNHSKVAPLSSQIPPHSHETQKSREGNNDQGNDDLLGSSYPVRIDEDIMEDDTFSFWGYGSIASEDETHDPQAPESKDNDQQGEAQLGHPLRSCPKTGAIVDECPLRNDHMAKLSNFAEKEPDEEKLDSGRNEVQPATDLARPSHQAEPSFGNDHPDPAANTVGPEQNPARSKQSTRRVSKGKQPQASVKPNQQTVLQQLQKNGDQQLVEPTDLEVSSRELDVELVSVTEATKTVARGDIKTHLQTVFYQWTDTFVKLNFHDIIDVALVCYFEPDKYIAPALMALRTLGACYSNQQAPSSHLRDYLLYAALQHWTPSTGEISINNTSFGLVEASLAIASYNLLPSKLVIPGEPLSLWLTVFSNIGQSQEKNFSGTVVKCAHCVRQEVVTSYFHTTALSIQEFVQTCSEDIIVNTTPVFDRHLYPSDIFHTAECKSKAELATVNQESGLLRFILFDHKHVLHDLEELSRLADCLLSRECGRFTLSRFLIQDSCQELKLVEIVMGQLCEYTGKDYHLLSSSDSLANHSFYGLVFHAGAKQPQEPLVLQTPHPPKIDDKHRVKQTICKVKRFQPDMYQPKMNVARKKEIDKEAAQPIVPCMSNNLQTAGNPFQIQPQPQSSSAALNAVEPDTQAHVLARPTTPLCSDAQTHCNLVTAHGSAEAQQPLNRDTKTAQERHQNKSPPRSPVHQHEQPKKTKIQDISTIPVVLISLFDGIGSVLPTFIQRFRANPAVYIAAEQDEELRQLISSQTGLRLDGQWTQLASGTIGIYLSDVVKLVDSQCRILREAAALCPNCKWLIVSGSPCQDLTYAGRYKGLLGIAGKRSVFFLVTQHTIWWLTSKFGKDSVRFLCENAGSMQEKHKSFFLWSLGLPLATDRKKLIWDPSTVFPVKRTRYFFRNIESHTEISQVDVFAQSDFKPLQTVSGQIIPVGPLLRVQRVYPGEIMHLSWIQYTPTCMLYDHSFFGGTAQFRLKCNLTTDGKIPQLPWATLLPPDWCHKWTQFLAAIRAGANSRQIDQSVIGIIPIFAFNYSELPFRPLTVAEIAQVAGLTEHLDDLRRKQGHLSELLVRNICGNSFHPALIASALGTDQDLREWLCTQASKLTHQCQIPGPKQMLENYKSLRLQVIQELSREHGDPQQVVQREMAPPCPFSYLQPDAYSSNPSELNRDEVFAKVQPSEALPTPIVPDVPVPECTPLSSTCKLILQQIGFEHVIRLVSFVGLPAFDSAMTASYFTYPADRAGQQYYIQNIERAFLTYNWKRGDLHFLLSTILHNSRYHIQGAGVLCFIQNGIQGHAAYYGAATPKWLIFCHCHVNLSTISFVTVQWTSYDRGFQISLTDIPFVYLKQPANDIDVARDVLALSYSTHSRPGEMMLLGPDGRAFSHTGCPWCAASLLFPKTQCPIHTEASHQLIHGLGLVNEAGHVSIALLPKNHILMNSAANRASEPQEAQRWCSSCENPVQSAIGTPGCDQTSEVLMNFIRIILVPDSQQTAQWFNAGSLSTFICRSSQIAAASKRIQQPITYELWKQYLGSSIEQQQQILRHYVTLCVWGNEALISRTCCIQPFEADLGT